MIVTNRRQLATEFRRMRLNRKLTQQQVAEKLYVAQATVGVRETHARLDLEAILDTAALFGYYVALVPSRHPGARPTGTGWPA